MAYLTKITLKNLGLSKSYLTDLTKDSDDTMVIARIAGILDDAKEKQGTIGDEPKPYILFTGKFTSLNLINDSKEEFRAKSLILPVLAQSLLQDEFEAGERQSLAFSIDITVKASESTLGSPYSFGVKSNSKKIENDPLTALLGDPKQTSLPAPKKTKK